MSIGGRPQPYRLGTTRELGRALPEIISNIDYLFQLLFEDLKLVDDAAITSTTGLTGLTGKTGLTGVPGQDGVDGEDGHTIVGPTGATGPQGPAGSGTGGTSIPGQDGIDGEDGLTLGLNVGTGLTGSGNSVALATPVSVTNAGTSTTTPTTVTTTGDIDDLNFSNAVTLRMNNATLSTIRGLIAGVDGQKLLIISVGAGQVDFAH